MQATLKSTTMNTKQPVLYTKIGLKRAENLAKELQNFTRQNNLLANIAGKDYMMVEGWQFIGTQIGLTDVIQSCDPVATTNEKEIKYKAEVEIINQNGTVISRGIAFCSNQENKKRSFEEYAIASMAQTRAVGKAYRNFLAWIVKMAGYETMPAEEANRDQLETDLSKAKQNVVKAFKDSGIDDSSEMIKIIETVCGKNILENIDDVNKVLSYIKEIE